MQVLFDGVLEVAPDSDIYHETMDKARPAPIKYTPPSPQRAEKKLENGARRSRGGAAQLRRARPALRARLDGRALRQPAQGPSGRDGGG